MIKTFSPENTFAGVRGKNKLDFPVMHIKIMLVCATTKMFLNNLLIHNM